MVWLFAVYLAVRISSRPERVLSLESQVCTVGSIIVWSRGNPIRFSKRCLLAVCVICSVVVAGFKVATLPQGRHQDGQIQLVVIGGSTGAGVQPGLIGGLRATRVAYPYLLADLVQDLTSEKVSVQNLACAGITAASLVAGMGTQKCDPKTDIAYKNRTPSDSQLATASSLLAAAEASGKNSVVTITIGEDDLIGCIDAGVVKKHCGSRVGETLPGVLERIIDALQSANSKAHIALATAYDPLLGYWRRHPQARGLIAREHQTFLQRINPKIRAVAKDRGLILVDYAKALGQQAKLDPNVVAEPPAISSSCQIAWTCASLHASPYLNKNGQKLLADTFLAALKPRIMSEGLAK